MDVAIARSHELPPKPPAHALRLELALRWMAQNLAVPNPVAGLCDYLQVSQITVHRLFRDHLGEPPATHHLRLRMDRARQLLMDGNSSVKEVAHVLGYRHANDLSRAYKRWFGCSPKQTSVE
jgi:transcriptional regulator GlxA family with amidase domain